MVKCPICGEEETDSQAWMEHAISEHPDNINMMCQKAKSM